MLEQKIDLLIVALEANTQALVALNHGPQTAETPAAAEPKKEKKAAPKPTEKPPEKTPDKAPEKPAGPTVEDFINLTTKLLDTDNEKFLPKLRALAEKLGVKRIREAHGTDKEGAAWAELNALAKEADASVA